jgi:hypothetical protein
MALETTWHTPTGGLVIHDLLVMDKADTQRGAGVLLRTATCLSGQVEVMADCAPFFDYGTAEGTWNYKGEG